MKLETRVFDLCQERYGNPTEMARAMGISVSQVYRVRQGKRPISEKFITGTVKAFPGYRLDDLFYIVPDGRRYGRRH
jgi:transcriptional regulator with XRE-family HTH domain